MEGTSRTRGSLVLLIDADSATRSVVRPLLLSYGLDVVQARTGYAALELLQHVPHRFRLVIVSLEMHDIPGPVLLETLRLFRPGLVTLCLTTVERTAMAAIRESCLLKPLRAEELAFHMAEALAGRSSPPSLAPVSADVITRATATFASSSSLLEAARELARGMNGDASAW